MQYVATTSSEDYETWPWYQDLRHWLDEFGGLGRKDSTLLPLGSLMPVGVCKDYCIWIMQTPEVRDMIYRRFVTRDFGNDLEKMLIKSASMYFVVKQGYDAQYCTRLSLGWHIAASTITGELRSVDDFDWQRFAGIYPNLFKSA